MTDSAKTRPVYRNIHVTQIVSYRLPPAGIVSILHRISGLLMFVLLPFVVWMLDAGLSSEISYDGFTNVFVAGVAGLPAWLVKLVVLGLLWAYLHHFIAGLRHLWMDATHSVSKAQGHSSALLTLGLSLALTVVLGAKLFGLY
ncbi:succinate dehydrogenase, cytochrome b556 subunit [Pelomonas aquatica]|jgi:succinate dehydrogenase / fumarate reductase cytochrome b subunit|uniref:Succinate dehydrogenase cytochrome b556 subunit n=1 Tax=Pelomonas aquatica TaxID=431058 RepID=A0A9X4LKF8_9BURK|nr:succinate dehydrogenase, cytochrome b556 subunit [Pelomonas aquatica]MCY4757069.1 succinate dehydrogenase, cytochrome b556 subunit [Pelomonas aquatica]MDG0864414.1 succinate dehydrogenase, cytochrome b556 subunit [Pelomonas aquatica]